LTKDAAGPAKRKEIGHVAVGDGRGQKIRAEFSPRWRRLLLCAGFALSFHRIETYPSEGGWRQVWVDSKGKRHQFEAGAAELAVN
jgi:hypothetical protein